MKKGKKPSSAFKKVAAVILAVPLAALGGKTLIDFNRETRITTSTEIITPAGSRPHRPEPVEDGKITYAEAVADAYIALQEERGHSFTAGEAKRLRELIAIYEEPAITKDAALSAMERDFKARGRYGPAKIRTEIAYMKQRIEHHEKAGLKGEDAVIKGMQDWQARLSRQQNVFNPESSVSSVPYWEVVLRDNMFNANVSLTNREEAFTEDHRASPVDTYLNVYTRVTLGLDSYVADRETAVTRAREEMRITKGPGISMLPKPPSPYV